MRLRGKEGAARDGQVAAATSPDPSPPVENDR